MPAEQMREQRVLVTGAAGFIGGALCARLTMLGAELTGVGRGTRPDGFEGEWVQCELADQGAVQALVRRVRPSYAFHLAGRTLGDEDVQAIWPTLHDNLLATVPLLAALVGTDCRRVILAASLRDPPSDDAAPTSPYAASKAASSAYGRMFHRLYGLPVVIARPFMVYGPGRQDMSKLMPYVASCLASGREAALSSGKAAFDFVYIDDVVDGLLAIATTSNVDGLTLDLGSGTLSCVSEVAMALAQRMGKTHLLKLGAMPDRRFDPQRAADVGVISARTGWRPRVSLNSGIERFLAWHADLRSKDHLT